MSTESNIAWTRSTFNPWIGCTEVSPGCDHCYARELAKRYGWAKWGTGKPRRRTAVANWRKPLQWNKQQQELIADWDMGGKDVYPPEPWRVFCASLADVFDNEVPSEWRTDLWNLIDATPNLSWLLVTKRIANVHRYVPIHWYHERKFPQNVRIMISVVNQQEADRDIPKLLALPCKNGISYEPALGPIDWCETLGMWWNTTMQCFEATGGRLNPNRLDWVIVGGESTQGTHKARPFVHGWARATVRQCKAAGVPVFVKQMGSLATNREGVIHPYKDRAGADPAEWPIDLQVQEFPE